MSVGAEKDTEARGGATQGEPAISGLAGSRGEEREDSGPGEAALHRRPVPGCADYPPVTGP